MFCSRPAGSAPEVTGPYCSHTRSGALPPDAWLSSVALACVMLTVLFGSHCTVTPLWAASYWSVSCFRPALSAALIAPDEQAAIAVLASSAVAMKLVFFA